MFSSLSRCDTTSDHRVVVAAAAVQIQKSKSPVLIRIQIIELAEKELKPSNSHYFLLAFALKLQWRQLLLEISRTSHPVNPTNQQQQQNL